MHLEQAMVPNVNGFEQVTIIFTFNLHSINIQFQFICHLFNNLEALKP